MVSPLLSASITKPSPSFSISANKFKIPCGPSQQKLLLPFVSGVGKSKPIKNVQNLSYSQTLARIGFQSSVIPLAVSLAFVLWSNPAHAGFLSGISGIESVPGPQLPKVDFLTRFNEENQKKYAENDARFKESPLLKKLLEQTKLNKEKNRQQILDKYCIRGAEWGVGDCSAEGMSPEDRDKFIAMLKQKAGVE
ncbi:peptide chain release factor 2 [Striga asiatica]|uniref:Peptide chain release factor 2 n=1 Tax=Striga asiatica TaxID=4170 RepID=A0A5A7PGM6_STRAF|nr:peptide chain release factor 2 [Striga asiatica]